MRSLITIVFLCYVYNGFEASVITNTSDEPTGSCRNSIIANCTSSVLALFDVKHPSNVDVEAMFNFSCGPDIDEIVQCIETRVKPYCTNLSNSDPLAYQLVHSFLPKISQTKEHCNDKDAYIEMMKCAQGFSTLRPFLDCAQGITLNKTMNTSDLCSMMVNTNACSYKYVDLACPKFKTKFLESAKRQGCANDIENAQEVTACDADMYKACSIEQRNSSVRPFEYACSAEGKAARVCIHKVRNLCSNMSSDSLEIFNLLPSAEIIEQMCSDGTGYRDIGVCYEQFSNKTEFKSCISTNITTKLGPCKIMQKSYDCTIEGIKTHCPSLNAFFHKYALKTYKKDRCTLNLQDTSAAVPTSIINCFITLVSCYISYMFTL